MALKRIGDVLVQEKVITEEQLFMPLRDKNKMKRLGEENLVRLRNVSEMQILKALENSTGVQRISLANL